MDKQTLSNYGWIVIAVLVLAVMIALATPFVSFIENGVVSARDGLFDVNQNAIDVVWSDGLPKDTDTMIYRTENLDPNITYTDYAIAQHNRAKIGYTGAEGEKLVIPVAFKDGDKWYKVIRIYNSAFYNCTNLTSITIPDSVTQICNFAFYNCTSLTSVVIGDSVTSIDEEAFYGCTSLTSVVIPDSVTSIGGSAFSDCVSLKSVVIPDSVENIGGGAFSSCYSLTSVVIPDSVTYIGLSTFAGCINLTSITIPNGVASINDITFKSCNNLTTIIIPNSVERIGSNCFDGCKNLESIIFNGTKSEWDSISKHTYNQFTYDYVIHCTDAHIHGDYSSGENVIADYTCTLDNCPSKS